MNADAPQPREASINGAPVVVVVVDDAIVGTARTLRASPLHPIGAVDGTSSLAKSHRLNHRCTKTTFPTTTASTAGGSIPCRTTTTLLSLVLGATFVSSYGYSLGRTTHTALPPLRRRPLHSHVASLSSLRGIPTRTAEDQYHSITTLESSSSSSSSGVGVRSIGMSSLPTTVYTESQLKEALSDLWRNDSSHKTETDDLDSSSRHLFGFDAFASHQLSMLQTITATVCLDYQTHMQDPNAPSLTDLEQAAKDFVSLHGPLLNLQTVIASTAPCMALAAEFKRASPSKGDIAPGDKLQAGPQAVHYWTAGADIISCLTEPRWFKGTLQDLSDIRFQTQAAAANAAAALTLTETTDSATTPPTTNAPRARPAILRKDFCVNRYMIAEAAAAGADTVLLIVAVLTASLLTDLIDYCRTTHSMEPLVEVHTDEELTVAIQSGARVIGVNNRNLHTFQMDLTTSERIAARLTELNLMFRHDDEASPSPSAPSTQRYTLCALSGMSTRHDVHRYRQAGLSMCLIGEALMRATDPVAAIASLCLDPADFIKSTLTSSTAATTATAAAYTRGTQIIKVCGITSADDALQACQAGAQLIGVIFASKSPRCVTLEQAQSVVQTVRTFGERSTRGEFGSTTEMSPLSHLVQSAHTMAQTVQQRPVVVGVFQNQDSSFIRDMVEQCGLDMIQLHGSEGMAAANRANFNVPVIRVVDVTVDPTTGAAATDAAEQILQMVTNDPAIILLDTAIKGTSTGGGGGTGVAFDWSIASRLQDSGLPVMIAGGLTPESISDCITRIRPFGVDVSSGVEASPGRKDHAKVQSFVRSAKAAAVQAEKGF